MGQRKRDGRFTGLAGAGQDGRLPDSEHGFPRSGSECCLESRHSTGSGKDAPNGGAASTGRTSAASNRFRRLSRVKGLAACSNASSSRRAVLQRLGSPGLLFGVAFGLAVGVGVMLPVHGVRLSGGWHRRESARFGGSGV